MPVPTVAKSSFNPVFWLMWLLPGSAVVAGLTTLGIAIRVGDRALPVDFHWEGARLDADFARARRAAQLGIAMTLEVRGGECRARFSPAADSPRALNLLLTHGSDASLDRRVRLARIAPGDFRADCAPVGNGQWRVNVDDDAATFSLRGLASGPITHLELNARNPDGPGP